jgi:Ca2+-binding RTX toxin-like protein
LKGFARLGFVRRAVTAAAAATLCIAFAPAVARATPTTALVAGGVLNLFSATAGVQSDITIAAPAAGAVVIGDPDGITPGANCSVVDATHISCDMVNPAAMNAATIGIGDGDDTLTTDNAFTVPMFIHSAGIGNSDPIQGGGGNDTFQDDALSNGADVFFGRSGTDTIDYSLRTNPVTVTIPLITIPGPGNDGETGEQDDIAIGMENIKGGTANDHLFGSVFANAIEGNDGDDTLTGGTGVDTLTGGADNDTLHADDGVVDTIICTGGGIDTGTFDLDPPETYIDCPDTDTDTVPDVADACPSQASATITGCPPPVINPVPNPPSASTATPAAKKCKKGRKLVKKRGKKKCVKKKRKKK